MLVDSHCHLDRLQTSAYDNGLEGAIAAAKERDIAYMLCVCISADNRQAVVDIANKYPGIFASVGVHPSDVTGDVLSVEELCAWATDVLGEDEKREAPVAADKIVAIGESGLDYYYSGEKADWQKQSFSNHLIAGAELGLPVIVHTRDAREDTLALMQQYASREHAGVMHCFTESWEMAEAALKMNFYISISGIVTFKNAQDLREVVKKIPLEKLLVETDSPYLAPVPYRGKSNEPKYVREVAEYIAELRGLSFDELAEITTSNFFNLFKKAYR